MLGSAVMSNGANECMGVCNHEEADSRLIVHIEHALQNGASSCLVRTVDTDVIVILVGMIHVFTGICPTADIWVAFGSGKHYKYYHINQIANSLGMQSARVLPLFHSFTGCDTTSAFFGKGKKTSWQAWKSYPDVTEAFMYMVDHPFTAVEITSPHFRTIERFTISMYNKNSANHLVNEERRDLFCKKNKSMDNIPPTQVLLFSRYEQKYEK